MYSCDCHSYLPSSVDTRFHVKELFLRLEVISNVEKANSTMNTPKHVHHHSLVPAVNDFLLLAPSSNSFFILLMILMLMKADRVSSPGAPYTTYHMSNLSAYHLPK